MASSRTATVLAVGMAGTLAALAIENPNREQTFFENGGFDGPSDFGNQYGSGITLGALSGVLLGAGYLAHDAALKETGGQMIRSLVYTTAAVTGLKMAFRRTRPNGGAYSFPSGHTAAAFAVAPILASRLGPAAGISAYTLAGATAMGRMEDRKHYLSDVVFGGALGFAIGYAVSHHRVEDDGTSAEPQRTSPLELGAGPDGAAISYRF